MLGNDKAVRYGIGVGRQGFTWSGVQSIVRKTEWPDWYPPPEMIARQPYLPRVIAGGPGNPLGARAMYIGGTEYRIHGTNDPSSIGKFMSSGCIRMTNDSAIDLYNRVQIGAKVIVLPQKLGCAAQGSTNRGTSLWHAVLYAPQPHELPRRGPGRRIQPLRSLLEFSANLPALARPCAGQFFDRQKCPENTR